MIVKRVAIEIIQIKIVIWLLALCYFAPLELYCQTQLFFQSYSSAQGLSQNSIYSIAQTSDDFMWFGTQDGLNRFDGKQFVTIKPQSNSVRRNSINFGKFSKMITALYADQADWLWVGTTQEIALYDRYTNQFVLPQEHYPGFVLPKGAWIKKVQEDQEGHIWVLTQNFGLFCYNKFERKMQSVQVPGAEPGKIIAFVMNSKGRKIASTINQVYEWFGQAFVPLSLVQTRFFVSKSISEIAIVKDQIWVITNEAEITILYQNRHGYYEHYPFDSLYHGRVNLSDPRVIHQSDSNTVWIGSRSEGLIKINLADYTFENAGSSKMAYALKRQFILGFYTDRHQITWIGLSGGGIAKYDQSKTRFGLWRTETKDGKVVPDNMILSIYSDNDIDFYSGTLYGGLLHTNTKTGHFKYYQPGFDIESKNASKNIYAVLGDGRDILWLATWGGLYSFDRISHRFTRYTKPDDEQTVELCAAVKLKKVRKLLVGGYKGGLRLFDLHTKKWEKCPDPEHILERYKLRVRYMKEVSDGKIYLCTETQNLVCYDYESGIFTFFPQLQKVSGISRHFLDDGRFLWVATDDGLLQVERTTIKIIKIWSTATGLPNDVIYALAKDKFNRIWVSTNLGLSALDFQQDRCQNYTEDDGLQAMEFNTASVFQSKDGRIWFGGINGFNATLPQLDHAKEPPLPPLITDIFVMNNAFRSDTATPYLKSITLPYQQNFIRFEFQVPHSTQTENISYFYKLQGVDTGWVASGTRSQVSYTQLNPGTYSFLLRSANSSNVSSSKVTSLKLTIMPPWFRTWWFYSVTIAAAGFSVIWYFRQRIRNIQFRAATEQKITQTEMAALRAQMNPHFIFNALNSINSFIVENKPHAASDYLTKFSRLIRLILENSRNSTNTLDRELEILRLYLLMESVRFEGAFEYEILLDDHLDVYGIDIPPMIIQPYVENAIWHGLLHKEGGGLVQVKLAKVSMKFDGEPSRAYLRIEVIDNGIGRSKALAYKSKTGNTTKSYGMDITRERIKQVNAANRILIHDLQDEDGSATGTSVEVYLVQEI